MKWANKNDQTWKINDDDDKKDDEILVDDIQTNGCWEPSRDTIQWVNGWTFFSVEFWLKVDNFLTYKMDDDEIYDVEEVRDYSGMFTFYQIFKQNIFFNPM